MTSFEYLQWLDKEIATLNQWSSRKSILIEVREKFLTIDFDTQPTDPKDFTEGLT